MTFEHNASELAKFKALTKKPLISRAEQAEIIRNQLEAIVADCNARGFTVEVIIPVGVIVGDTQA